MKGMMGGAALLAAMMALTPPTAEAQRGARGQREMMMRRGQPGIEHIMRLRERLELSEDQIARLDVIRAEVVQHRAGHQAQMAELRSQVMAGELEAAAAREQAEIRREQGEAFAEDVRSRVEAILSDAQREELEDVVGRARAFRQGRASALRDGRRSFRSGRGAMRGGQRAFRRGGRGGAGWGQRGMRRGGPGGGFGPELGFEFIPEDDFGFEPEVGFEPGDPKEQAPPTPPVG